jgi:hypothetical protein
MSSMMYFRFSPRKSSYQYISTFTHRLSSRWRRAKEEEEGTSKKHVKRPYLATECDNLGEAERWRQQVGNESLEVEPVIMHLVSKLVLSFYNNTGTVET